MYDDDEGNLLAIAESMVRAGYGHKEIERALTRMSPRMRGDSGRLTAFGSLRRLLTWRAGPLGDARRSRLRRARSKHDQAGGHAALRAKNVCRGLAFR
jgi:hypothetical protein